MASSRYTVQHVKDYVSESRSWKQVCEKVGLVYSGGNVNTLKKIAVCNGFDFSHFLGRGWNIGGKAINEIPPEDVFVKGKQPTSHALIKNKVIKYNLINSKICSGCGIVNEWNNQTLVLHLDHVDGDVTNNELNNLRFLCPNCHSQTDTYCVSREGIKRKFCKDCGIPLKWHNKNLRCQICISELSKQKKHKQKKNKARAKTKKRSACRVNRGGCRPHDRIDKRKFHVSREELQGLIDKHSYCAVGRMFGVSDNAIRKRAKKLGISI